MFPRRAAIFCWLLLCFVLLLGCRKTSAPNADWESPWFEDVTEQLGIDFTHDPGPLDGKYPMPQITGSGCATADLDGDGRLDLYLLNNGGPTGRPNRLYRQKPNGTFEDVSAGSGLDVAGYCMGVAIGDIDGDGLPDVLLTEYHRVRLFRNLGGGKFQDVSSSAGIENDAWATAAAFVDFDRDARLDLVIVNYVRYDPTWKCLTPTKEKDYCHPNLFAGGATRLYRNVGNGRFRDVTEASGLAALSGPGLGVVCADFDGDGWVDLFVANDGKPNHLWINQKNGTFVEQAVKRGVAFNGVGQTQAGMGVAFGDVDGDGLSDLFVTHLGSEQHTLWTQGPRGMYGDRSGDSGLTKTLWRATGFGVCLNDLDNDGFLDAVLVNGRVTKSKPQAKSLPGDAHWHPYLERNQCFVNDGKGRFRDRSTAEPALCAVPNVGRGLACGDVDGDGGMDVLFTTIGGSVRLLRNVAPNRGHWLFVRALDSAGRRDLLGAEVSVRAGEMMRTQTVRSAGSYLSASDPRAHFGLSKESAYDEIRVVWPSGKPRRERFTGGQVDCVVSLRQGTGTEIVGD